MNNNHESSGKGEVFGVSQKDEFVISFHAESGQIVGGISIKEGALSFDGNADESAKCFIKTIIKQCAHDWQKQATHIKNLESQVESLKQRIGARYDH